MREVFIPKALQEIGDHAFSRCPSLEKFVVAPENEIFFTDEHGALYQRINSNIVLVRVPTTLAGVYRVPDGVTHIGSGAFEGCAGLTAMILPPKIRQIKNDAFCGCTGLKGIATPSIPYGCTADMFQDSPKLRLYGAKAGDVEDFAKRTGIPFVIQDVYALLAKHRKTVK